MVFSACHIWTLFTYYLHMYMSSTHYLGIWVFCAHYLQWSLIYYFLTDNADVIHMSSLVLFIYPIMYNLHIFCTDAHCPCHLHVVHTNTHHLLIIFTTPGNIIRILDYCKTTACSIGVIPSIGLLLICADVTNC